jgi:hypothetical protein
MVNLLLKIRRGPLDGYRVGLEGTPTAGPKRDCTTGTKRRSGVSHAGCKPPTRRGACLRRGVWRRVAPDRSALCLDRPDSRDPSLECGTELVPSASACVVAPLGSCWLRRGCPPLGSGPDVELGGIAVSRARVRSVAMAISLLVSATALMWAAPSALASPSATTDRTAKVDCVTVDPTTGSCQVPGVVYAITQVGDKTYIGGSFKSVSGVPRQNVAAISKDGTLDLSWNPSTDGVVYALAASADGSKVFLGGGYTTVGGQSRGRLAAVSPDTGELLADWAATARNNLVRALVADSGDRLYVGGSFSSFSGRSIARLAAVSQSTGAVDTSFAAAPSATVRALALSDDGSKLYAGGPFTTIGGASRPGAAELSPTSGTATSFAPTDGGVVISMDVTPNGRLFFGTTSNRTYAYDPSGSDAPLYRVRTSGDVQAILATNDEVYIGGHFANLPEAKLERVHVASFLTADGTPSSWNPGANGSYGVWAIGLTRTALSPDAVPALSIGGDFTRVAGAARRGYARFSCWSPTCGSVEG